MGCWICRIGLSDHGVERTDANAAGKEEQAASRVQSGVEKHIAANPDLQLGPLLALWEVVGQ